MSKRACERGGKRRPVVPERPRTGVGAVGERSREGKEKGREEKVDRGCCCCCCWWWWLGEKEELEEGRG